jgi:transcriptional activator of cad operon
MTTDARAEKLPTTRLGAQGPQTVSIIGLGCMGMSAAVLFALGAVYWVYGWFATPQVVAIARGLPPQVSIAVLPFLDLTTQEMNEEYFADGMTEELIGDLSKISGLRVPSPTSSFYFKGKKLPLADIARQLGVTYVLDGSVRKSGDVYRVAARLIRADNGYVSWTETYDRPLDDVVKVQKDVAAEMTKAVRAALSAAAGGRAVG